MSGRRGKGEGSIFQLPDGRWRAMIDLGWSTGKRRRKAVTRATRGEVVKWLREAQRSKDAGALTSRTPTVAEWFETYLTEIAASRVRARTLQNYRRDVETHIVPALGRIPLDRLEPVHITRLYRAKSESGLSPATVRHVHAVLRHALTMAVRWGKVPRNVAQLVEPPPSAPPEINPLSVEEARALLSACRGDRLEARWVIGLSLGLRQSEALGLWWEDVDLDTGIIHVRRQLTRPGGPGDGLTFGPLKTAKSRRVLALPGPLLDLLKQHRGSQQREQDIALNQWRDRRLVFATPLGTPIDHRNDARTFKALCDRAGIRRARVHDLRHTAATLLIAQGQHPRVIMQVLGHSQIAVTMNVYGHVLAETMRDAATAVTTALWGPDAEGLATPMATKDESEA